MHVLTLPYILIYVLSVKVDTWFVPTAAELRGITIEINKFVVYFYTATIGYFYTAIDTIKKEEIFMGKDNFIKWIILI